MKYYRECNKDGSVFGVNILGTDEVNLILGALDSLGVALCDHDHQWTEGERAIYEKAIEIVSQTRQEKK